MKFVAPFAPALVAIVEAIRGTAGWLGSDENVVRLMKNNPNIDPNMVIGSIVQADFPDYQPIPCADFPQSFVDPLTGEWFIRLFSPAGGWWWTTGEGVTLPQTIYGVYVLDVDETILVGAAKFPTPIVLTAGGQSFSAGDLVFKVSSTPLGG